MYRVLIVDDEKIVRKGIKRSVDWNLMDMEVAAEAENGIEALEQAELNHPNIILLDIYMPLMDGLEFARIMKQRDPGVYIVIITGYDDFEYVRTALRMGLDDYVLKPVTREDVQRILEKAVDVLKNRVSVRVESKSDRIERVLNDILKSESGCLEMIQEVELENQQICVGIVRMNRKKCEIWTEDLINYAICNILNELLERDNRGKAFITYKNEVALIITDAEKIVLSSETSYLIKAAKSFLGVDIRIALSGVGDSEQLKILYQRASAAEHYCFVKSEQIVFYDEICKYDNSLHYPTGLEQRFRTSYQAGSEVVNSLIDEFKDYIKASGASPTECRVASTRFISTFVSMLENSGAQDVPTFSEIAERIESSDNIDVLATFMKELSVRMDGAKSKRRTARLMCDIVAYIQSNFTDPALNLKKCSEDLYLSTSYISLIIKKEQQTTFVDYLNEVRIQKACELLMNPDNKIYEISKNTGFTNAAYFSQVFKKLKGISPKQYREGGI